MVFGVGPEKPTEMRVPSIPTQKHLSFEYWKQNRPAPENAGPAA